MANTEIKIGDTVRITNSVNTFIKSLIGKCGRVEVMGASDELQHFTIGIEGKRVMVYPTEVEMVMPYDATPLHRWLTS